jgi:hypothetical protein
LWLANYGYIYWLKHRWERVELVGWNAVPVSLWLQAGLSGTYGYLSSVEEMYVSIHQGEFQHTLSETLGLLLWAKQGETYWYVNTKVGLLYDVVHQTSKCFVK